MPKTSIKTVWDMMSFLVRKNSSAFLNSEQFNLIINRAQMAKFMQLYGNPHEYQPGMPVPRMAYEQTQKITDDLKQFKQQASLQVDSDGRAVFPLDYVHTLSLGYFLIKNGKCSTAKKKLVVPIEVIDQDKEFVRRASLVVPPTRKYPVVVIKDSYYQFFPEDLKVVELSYLRQPKPALYAVTIVNDREVWNQAASVDLEWPDVAVNDIIMLAMSYMGISIQGEDIQQYSERKIVTGN